MDYLNIIITICSAIGTIITIAGIFWRFSDKIEKRFDKMENTIKDHGDRLSRLEGKMEHVDGMLQTIVSFLLGHKTGTEK